MWPGVQGLCHELCLLVLLMFPELSRLHVFVHVHLGSPPRQLLLADRGEVGPRGTTL